MKRAWWLILLLSPFALVGAGCNASVKLDPDGYRCDSDGTCPSGFACREGRCRRDSSMDPSCIGVVCNSPPAGSCLSSTSARSFAPRCMGGMCFYDSVDVTCPQGCVQGACVDACTGVTCNAPPTATCSDSMTLRSFAATGTCSGGTCSYAPVDTTCESGCTNGTCGGMNICELNHVMCETPPDPECMGNVLRTSTTPGTCDPTNGQCRYAYNDTTCANGCSQGRCLTATLAFTQLGPRVRFAVNSLDVAPGSSGSSALVVGNDGKIARWDGTAWSELMPLSSRALKAVSFVSGSVAYAVGESGTAMTIKPSTGQLTAVSLTAASSANLVAVSGRAEGEVIIASSAGDWWRARAGAWTNGSLSTSAPWQITGAYLDESLRERLVGSCNTPRASCVAYRFLSGGTPAWTAQQQVGSGFTAVGGSYDVPTANTSSEAMLGLSDNSLVTHSTVGFTTTRFFNTQSVDFDLEGDGVVGITAQSQGLARDLFVLTPSVNTTPGHLYRVARGVPDAVTSDQLETFFDESHLSPNESSGVLVAEVRRAANVNNIFRRGSMLEALDVGEDFVGASLDPAGTLVMSSPYGDVISRRASANTFEFRRPSGDWSIEALESRNGTGTLLVGQDANTHRGVVVRVTPSAFTTIASQSNVVFHAVCRVSDSEAWVVGSGGTILRVTGSGATAVTSPTTRDLLGVDCAAGVAVACGNEGTVLRYANNTWAVVTPAFPMAGRAVTSCKLAVGGGYVGGDGFFASYSLMNGWTTLPGAPGLTHLIVRGPLEVYGSFFSGGNSTISRFDGTRWSSPLLSVAGRLGGGVQGGTRVVWGGTLGALVEGR